MRAVRLHRHGGPEVLHVEEVPVPEVGDHDVLVRVHATSVNSWDLKYRAGMLPPSPLPGRAAWPLPFQLGRDAAGVVERVGPAVTAWSVGDRVVQMPHPACGHCPMCVRGRDNLCLRAAYPGHQVFGGYAEYVARPETALLKLPDAVSYEAAGASMWAFTTPLNCLRRRAPVGPGDILLLTGASGGLASSAVQLGKLAGATVIGTTTKPERAGELRAIGFDHVVDVRDPEAVAAVRRTTGGLGVDAAWDCVGGTPSFRFAASCTRLGGAVAVLGTPSDAEGFGLEISTLSFIFGELNVVGVRAATRQDQQSVVDLLASGAIAPVIDRVYPLADAAAAHEYLESRRQIGKVVLMPLTEE